MWVRVILLLAVALYAMGSQAQTTPAPLVLEAKIPLGEVRGRIDHLAVDVTRRRLFVAELGNDSLGVVDLAASKVLRTLSGFSEPQGVGYAPFADLVYVANAGDGSVRVLQGEDLSPAARVDLGDDADNVRVDTARHRVVVGYGAGALAIIDPATKAKIQDIRLKAHPESFQIDGDRVLVNVPDARSIEVVDLANNAAIGAWPTVPNRSNFPMAVDRDTHRLFVVFRSPARLVTMSAVDGKVVGSVDTCGDADDVFLDMQRRRVYVTCGTGVVDVFEDRAGNFQHWVMGGSSSPGAD